MLTEQEPFGKRHSDNFIDVREALFARMVWRNVLRVVALCIVLALLLTSSITRHETQYVLAAAPAVGEATRDARWTQYTRDRDMLASNDARTIWVDDYVLWFGGENGFSRYDGAWTSHMTVAGLNPGSGGGTTIAVQQAVGQIQALAREAANNTLWAGSSTGLLLAWDGRAWSLSHDLKSDIYALLPFAGELWVGTADGLYRYDRVSDETLLVDALGRQPIFALQQDSRGMWVGAGDGLWRLHDGRWAQVGDGERNLDLGVYALALSPENSLVVGTPYGIGWQPSAGERWTWYETYDEADFPALIQTLAFDQRGVLWAGSDGAGAFSLRLDGNSYENYGYTGDLNLTTRFVRDIAVDRDNSIWFATPAGIFRFQAYRWIHESSGPSGDERNFINDLLVGRDGSLWAATGGAGVRQIADAGGTEVTYNKSVSAPEIVYTLAEDESGAIWAGGASGLFRFTDDVWTQPVRNEELPGAVVTSLAVDGQELWIATASGLAHYALDEGEVRPVNSLMGLSVEALALDNLGRIWAGTQGAGVWVREMDGRWRQFRHDPLDPHSIPGNDVYSQSLAPDAENVGGMWAIINGAELARWDGHRWERMERSLPLPSNLLWKLYSDPSDGSLWVGSEAGVTRYDGMTWHTFGANDGLQSAVTYAVVRTTEGGYWFGGPTGLTYFLPDKTPPWVKLGPLAKEHAPGSRGLPVLAVGEDVLVRYDAGDLQTAREQLRVLQRVAGPTVTTPWVSIEGNYVRHHFDEEGVYTFELVARDEAFNYSEVASLGVEVVVPPVMIALPGLGPVEVGVFRTLAALGSLIVLGTSYMSWVILSNRRRALEALSRGFNPYISGEPVRRDDMFFGRRDLLQRIVDTLHSNSIMIHGERRIGKTSLLLNLMTALREVNDPEYWFVPVYVDLEGTPQETFFQLLIDEVLANVESLENAAVEITPKLSDLRYYTKLDNSYSDRDFNRDLNRITEALEEYGEHHDPGKHLRLILLIDEMDVMGSYDRLIQQQLRRIFMREFAATLGAVVAGIQISKEWDRVESPWFNLFNDIALTPFSREQAIELLVEPVRGYYVYDPAAIEFILDHAHGRPYKIQQYGLEAVNHMLAARRRRITLADVEAAHQRLELAERAGKPSGLRRHTQHTLLQKLQEVVRPGFQSAEPTAGNSKVDTPGREDL